jgi:hypothetical protein
MCRILEYARGGTNVELWDVSGNRRFDAGWAAIQKDAAGVIIVFDGDDGDQERAVALW